MPKLKMGRLIYKIQLTRRVQLFLIMFLLFVMFLRFYEQHISEDIFEDTCTMKDPQCLAKLFRQFLSATRLDSAELADYGFKRLDPFIIEKIDFVITDGLKIILENIRVYGFNETEMSSYLFNMDEEIVTISLNMKHKLKVVSEASVNLEEVSKVFTGAYVIDMNATTKIEFPYEIVNVKPGLSHFNLGPQNKPLNIECEMASDPVFEMSLGLHEAFLRDPDLKKKTDTLGSNREELRKRTTCEIVKRAVTTLIENFRAAASLLNRLLSSIYFKDR